MLTEALVQEALTNFLDCVLPVASIVEYRLVGTASMLLRGVNLSSSDIDLLLKERTGVDLFHRELMQWSTIEGLQPPTLLEGATQYFARYALSGAIVELSTVEFEVDVENDTLECVGRGPWTHFDLVPCGPYLIPTVAVELRLLTELSRNRVDRYHPILDYMQTRSCNIELIKRGFMAMTIPHELQMSVLECLSQTG